MLFGLAEMAQAGECTASISRVARNLVRVPPSSKDHVKKDTAEEVEIISCWRRLYGTVPCRAVLYPRMPFPAHVCLCCSEGLLYVLRHSPQHSCRKLGWPRISCPVCACTLYSTVHSVSVLLANVTVLVQQLTWCFRN